MSSPELFIPIPYLVAHDRHGRDVNRILIAIQRGTTTYRRADPATLPWGYWSVVVKNLRSVFDHGENYTVVAALAVKVVAPLRPRLYCSYEYIEPLPIEVLKAWAELKETGGSSPP